MLDVTRLPVRDPWLAIEVRDEVDSTNALLVAAPNRGASLSPSARARAVGGLRARGSPHTRTGPRRLCGRPSRRYAGGLGPAGRRPRGGRGDHRNLRAGATLKRPNDVLLPGDGDRKVAGVPCEWTPVGVVVGVGINVTQARADLPLETATSVHAAGVR